MARHRRYPVKKTKKVKSKDPIQRMADRRKNRAPKKEELNEQALSRRLLEIQKISREEEVKPRTRSGKRRSRNKFYELTARMGFKKRPWEDDAMLANRAIRHNNMAIDEELMKVNMGTAGRDRKEIESDFKKLDEQERRKKLLKVAANEKRKKLREKEERFRQSQLARQIDVDDDFESFVDNNEPSRSDEEEKDEDEPDAKEKARNQVVRQSTNNEKVQKQPVPQAQSKKRLTSNERARQKRKDTNRDRKKHLILNAREVIPFGEVVSAPPKFTSGFRKTSDPLFAQAGKKDLLLKGLIKSDNKSLYSGLRTGPEPQESIGITEEERQLYIQAYRNLKKKNII